MAQAIEFVCAFLCPECEKIYYFEKIIYNICAYQFFFVSLRENRAEGKR